jgi:hypothetical protein
LSLTLLCAACGSTAPPTATTTVGLAGWTPQGDTPGISQLAPDLSGLDVTATTDRRALVRNGDAIRATAFTFATENDAREALKRGAGDDYVGALADAFRADATRKDGGVRLVLARPAEPGSDTVEVYLIRRGRTLTVAELVSGKGVPPALRQRTLAAVSR